MFDLIAFIRQYLTPTLRQPIIVGLCRVLLAPLMTVYTAVMQARNDVLSTANSTGQVAVLEDLLNQATFGSGVGAVYLLDGDGVNFDFQVVTPAGLPLDVLTRLNALVRTYKLLGKRFVIQNQVTYAQDKPVSGQSVSWATGFPYIAGGILHFALNEHGDFRVKVTTPTYTLIDSDYHFDGPTTDNYIKELDPTLAYTVQIINLSKTVTQAVAPAPGTTAPVARMGYSRFADSHQTSLWFILTRSMRCTISLVSGSASGDGWSTDVARVIDSTQTLREWTSGLRLNPTANGQGGIVNVTYYITVSELDGAAPVTYAWTPQAADTNGIIDIALNPTSIPVATINHAPVVANQPTQFTLTGQGDQVYNLPANTFSDPDGDTLTLSASGLAAGVTFSPSNRTLTFPAGLANGTYNQTVTATDPAGASVSVAVSVVLNRAAVGATSLDAILGPEVTYVGRLDVGWCSKPDLFNFEIVPGSFNGQFARIRRIGTYDPGGRGIVKVKFKERYCDPADVSTFWIECGKPFVIKEYHTSGTDINKWDRQEYWFDSCYEYGGVIN